MAVDEAILEAAGDGDVLPTLRLYAWQPACLSLGYSQSIQDVDRSRLQAMGWGLVRRLTGGKAILHVDELTYALIAQPCEDLVAGSLLESYHRISTGLLKALFHLSIQGEISGNPTVSNRFSAGPICFEVPSAFEITFQGKKILGSAQARRKNGILQHGSLPLHGDLGRIIQVLNLGNEEEQQSAVESLSRHAINVETVTGRMVTWKEAARAIAEAFEEELGVHFEQANLTSQEESRARELVRTKYSQPGWTERV
jgi:lipoate-protein ligase A